MLHYNISQLSGIQGATIQYLSTLRDIGCYSTIFINSYGYRALIYNIYKLSGIKGATIKYLSTLRDTGCYNTIYIITPWDTGCYNKIFINSHRYRVFQYNIYQLSGIQVLQYNVYQLSGIQGATIQYLSILRETWFYNTIFINSQRYRVLQYNIYQLIGIQGATIKYL